MQKVFLPDKIRLVITIYQIQNNLFLPCFLFITQLNRTLLNIEIGFFAYWAQNSKTFKQKVFFNGKFTKRKKIKFSTNRIKFPQFSFFLFPFFAIKISFQFFLNSFLNSISFQANEHQTCTHQCKDNKKSLKKNFNLIFFLHFL